MADLIGFKDSDSRRNINWMAQHIAWGAQVGKKKKKKKKPFKIYGSIMWYSLYHDLILTIKVLRITSINN